MAEEEGKEEREGAGDRACKSLSCGVTLVMKLRNKVSGILKAGDVRLRESEYARNMRCQGGEN